MTSHSTLLLPTDVPAKAGGFVHEEILVAEISAGRFMVLRTPGAVMGLAAGDTIELSRTESVGFRLVSPGENIGLQIYCAQDLSSQRELLVRLFAPLRGRLDGYTVNTLVVTVPHEAGFSAIEEAMGLYSQSFPEDNWQYANVYDDKTGEILPRWCPTPSR
jgi:hypothetical protein